MSVSDRAFPLACGVTLAALAGLAALALVLWISTPSPARTLYPGQWAQVDPAEREWFKAQRSPQSRIPCCDESDGTYAEESLTPPEGKQNSDGKPHYWVRFAYHYYPNGELREMQSDWMEVPDEVVIHDPNRHGAPVVWWVRDTQLRIRCYAPGGGF